MSRSYKKTQRSGVTKAGSEKKDKRWANRAFRRAVHIALKRDAPLPFLREVSNVWCFAKDGKKWWRKHVVEKYPELLRK